MTTSFLHGLRGHDMTADRLHTSQQPSCGCNNHHSYHLCSWEGTVYRNRKEMSSRGQLLSVLYGFLMSLLPLSSIGSTSIWPLPKCFVRCKIIIQPVCDFVSSCLAIDLGCSQARHKPATQYVAMVNATIANILHSGSWEGLVLVARQNVG